MRKTLFLLPLWLSSTVCASNHQIGIAMGYGDTEGPDNWSDSGFAAKIDYAYQFHPNFAAEIGYAGVEGMTSNFVSAVFGTTEQEVNYSTGFAGLKAVISPTSFLDFYAVGGANYSEVKKTYTPAGGAKRTDSHTGTHPYYGVGADLIFFSHVGLNLEYRKFILANDFESDVVFTGINVRF
ncbi:outer membrane beta-barrel protein [Vibrio aquimaris]|uniref:OmpA-like transmembrane domain protein n=1 Tax=Vibrio aquimaris TaxID=2587862 RepID=A0A5P9CKJ0_9VIBR|nr:outer membrane beta-barrel protein [Vibrio aquimaris]QFT26453.1 OmpA-like transmembrane domain protein [Vibrio aquimaris]